MRVLFALCNGENNELAKLPNCRSMRLIKPQHRPSAEYLGQHWARVPRGMAVMSLPPPALPLPKLAVGPPDADGQTQITATPLTAVWP